MINVILDTDIGSDCDDAGALAVLHRLISDGQCRVLAMTNCLSRPSGPAAIDAINRYYGRGDIPIGTLKKPGYFPAHITKPYSEALQKEYENAYPCGADCPDAIPLLRKTLTEQPDNSVDIITIGPLTNIRFLLESPPDSISPLTGEALVNRKVRQLCCMGGRFDSGSLEEGEFNIVCDIPAAQTTVERLHVPIIFSPWELGAAFITGHRLMKTADESNPVYRSYQLFCGKPRESWDPMTVLYAVYPDEKMWKLSNPGKVSVDNNGVTTFEECPGGNARILYARDAEYIFNMLEDMLLPKSNVVVANLA